MRNHGASAQLGRLCAPCRHCGHPNSCGLSVEVLTSAREKAARLPRASDLMATRTMAFAQYTQDCGEFRTPELCDAILTASVGLAIGITLQTCGDLHAMPYIFRQVSIYRKGRYIRTLGEHEGVYMSRVITQGAKSAGLSAFELMYSRHIALGVVLRCRSVLAYRASPVKNRGSQSIARCFG